MIDLTEWIPVADYPYYDNYYRLCTDGEHIYKAYRDGIGNWLEADTFRVLKGITHWKERDEKK